MNKSSAITALSMNETNCNYNRLFFYVKKMGQEVDNGTAKLIPGEEVFEKILKMKSGLSQ